MSLTTEHGFLLPKGYVDDHGELHRKGTMRLATARDEIQPQRDPRVQDNQAYLTIIMLSRVVTELGDLSQITPKVIEGLFASDLAYLQDFYEVINFGDPSKLESGDPSARIQDSGAYRPEENGSGPLDNADLSA